MNRLAVVVPFKGRHHKSRLSGMLDETRRRGLALSMLERVLRAIVGAGLGGSCFLVTSDGEASLLAKRLGVKCLLEPKDAGVNSAVRRAVRSLRSFNSFLVVPADLPLLSARDVAAVLSLRTRDSVVISPSASFSGTNLLLFGRKHAPVLSYDRNSFWNHLASAASMRLVVVVCTRAGITLDLDDSRDLGVLLALGVDNSVTRYLKEVIEA